MFRPVNGETYCIFAVVKFEKNFSNILYQVNDPCIMHMCDTQHNEICSQSFEMNHVYTRRLGKVDMLSYVNLLLKRFVSL